MSRTLLFFLFAIAVFQLKAQSKNGSSTWIEQNPNGINHITLEKTSLSVSEFRVFQLNLAPLSQALTKAVSRNGNTGVVLPFPSPDGHLHRFQVSTSNTLHPELAKKFPTIQTFEGIGIDDPTSTIRFELTPNGLTAMIWSAKDGTQVIQPYQSSIQSNEYIVYYKKSANRNSSNQFSCQFDDIDQISATERQTSRARNNDGQLRTYRLALAGTGEYTAQHGGTVVGALAGMATTINRVNGILKNDVAIELQIIANNNLIVFTNAATDNYTNNDGSEMLDENQNNIDSIIGNANYDIGHVFSTGGGGVAYLSSVCTGSVKAGGVTGSSVPQGDAFDVDFVAHEIGHQLGATHTQNNDCNRTFASSFEPGSGSTIMSYAGICFPNVQNNSDDYYHSVSIDQIIGFTTSAGDGCATKTATSNTQPTAAAGVDYFVPRSTPFELEGTGTDIDNNVLTYVWEQMDNTAATMPPLETATNGPSFRSVPPASSPIRQFPAKGTNKNHPSSTWEVLPTVARTMNFRFTVRDNFSGGGSTANDNMTLTFADNTGPFKVNYPNGGNQVSAGISQTITWDVAGTNLAPINCANVDIFLSLDGGDTYPTVLAQNVSNDGSHDVIIQNDIVSATARIKIKGSNNVFFNVSNSNFEIIESSPGYVLNISPASLIICKSNSVQYSIDVVSVDGYSGNVDLSAVIPAGLPSYSFQATTVSTGNSTTLTVNTNNSTASGLYQININGQSGAINTMDSVTLTVVSQAPATTVLSAPADNAPEVEPMPTFSWGAATDAAAYKLELASDAAFASIIYTETGLTATNFALPFSLQSGSVYYWRVQSSNECGAGNNSLSRSFTVSSTVCQEYTNTTDFLISDASINTVSSPIIISESGSVQSIEVSFLINHSWIGDLTVELESPTGVKAEILMEICGNEDTIRLTFANSGLLHSAIPCPPYGTANIFKPAETFDIFNGIEANGTWKLNVKDSYVLDGGALKNWTLEVCRTVDTQQALNVLISNSTNPTCNGGNNGSINTTIIGGTAPYTIAWSNGSDQLNINNLSAGNYTITVTDDSSNVSSANVTLIEPTAIVLADNIQHVTCNGDNTGSIQIYPSGGTPSYSYNWANGVQQFNNLNLPSGNYSLTVTDNNGCETSASYTVNEPSAIQLSHTKTDAVNEQNGNIDLSVSGGTGAYSYLWSNNATTEDLSSLTSGVYDVTVTDANSCTETSSVQVLNVNSNISCYSITVNITLDNYGEENRWEIKDADDAIIATMGPFNNFENEAVYTANLCVPPGCYDFTIFDLWGDGMCCSYGQGAYEVIEDVTGKKLASGGSFSKEESTSFCVPSAIAGVGIVEYCGAEGRNTQYEWIETVEIAGQTFNSGSNSGYGDFSDTIIDVTIGSVLNIAFTPGFGFFDYHENWQVWIDYNGDGDFEDDNEQAFLSSGNSRVTGMIGIPNDATPGKTRIRIAMKWGELIQSCESFSWGEVEDYTIDLLPSVTIAEKIVPLAHKSTFTTGKPNLYTVQERDEAYSVKLFPNPTTDYLHLEWEDNKEKQYKLLIYNTLGQIQEELILPSKKGLNKPKIQVSHLPAGIYIMTLGDKKKVITKEFVIAK